MNMIIRTIACIAVMILFSTSVLTGQSEIKQPEFVTNPPEHTEEKVFAVGISKNTSEQRAQLGAESEGRQALVDTLRAHFNKWTDLFVEEIGDSTQTAYKMEDVVSGFYVQRLHDVRSEEQFMTPDPETPQIIHAYVLLSHPAESVKNIFLEQLGRHPDLYNLFLESDTYAGMTE